MEKDNLIQESLNKNDYKLLAYCFKRPKYLSDIAKNIGISVKNVSTRIENLNKKGLIDFYFIKNKKYVKTKQNKRICAMVVEELDNEINYLKKIKEELK